MTYKPQVGDVFEAVGLSSPYTHRELLKQRLNDPPWSWQIRYYRIGSSGEITFQDTEKNIIRRVHSGEYKLVNLQQIETIQQLRDVPSKTTQITASKKTDDPKGTNDTNDICYFCPGEVVTVSLVGTSRQKICPKCHR